MIKIKRHIIKEGGKAFYDDIPRYKNPYSHDDINYSFWFDGWDSANKEHELFTENQLLKIQNEELIMENQRLVSVFSEKEDNIDTILDVLLKHLENGFFVFSRGNIKTGIFQIKDIISKI